MLTSSQFNAFTWRTTFSFEKSSNLKREKNKDTLAIVIGWFAAQQDILNNYSNVYQETGIDTLSFVPRENALISSSSRDSLVQRLGDEIAKHAQGKSRIFFHALSGNGANIYLSFLNKYGKTTNNQTILTTNNKPLSVIGTVFDSVPLSLSPMICGRALTLGTLSVLQRGKKKPTKYHHTLLTPFFTTLHKAINLYPPFSKSVKDYHSLLDTQPTNIKQAFIYSDEDLLVEKDLLATYALKRRNKGADLTLHKFQQSHHCRHLQTDSERYKNIIGDFKEYYYKLNH